MENFAFAKLQMNKETYIHGHIYINTCKYIHICIQSMHTQKIAWRESEREREREWMSKWDRKWVSDKWERKSKWASEREIF